jgi:anaerobic selenocysteine-containing dehydrogenase
MFRRRFIQLMTLAGAGSLATNSEAAQTKTVTYSITGFSCITCAVGLDVMLRRNKGVLRSNSSYPNASTTIDFNPAQITNPTLKSLIAEMGFTAEEKP